MAAQQVKINKTVKVTSKGSFIFVNSSGLIRFPILGKWCDPGGEMLKLRKKVIM